MTNVAICSVCENQFPYTGWDVCQECQDAMAASAKRAIAAIKHRHQSLRKGGTMDAGDIDRFMTCAGCGKLKHFHSLKETESGDLLCEACEVAETKREPAKMQGLIDRYERLEAQVADLRRQMSDVVSEMAAEYAPVKVGWIIEDGNLRIKVREVRLVISNLGELSINTWVASGPALTKKNEPSGKHSGSHSILVYNINSQKNTVKIISRGEQ